MEFFDLIELLIIGSLWFWIIIPPLFLVVLPIYKYVKYKKSISFLDGILLCFVFSIPWIIFWIYSNNAHRYSEAALSQICIYFNFAIFLVPKILISFGKWLKKFIADFK